MKCEAEEKDPDCAGPFAKSGVYVCPRCAVIHDATPPTGTCACDDCNAIVDGKSED